MKFPVKLSVVLIVSLVSSTAVAVESRYPGKDRLIIGEFPRQLATSFGLMRKCDHKYDFRGYLKKLRSLSLADWRAFNRQASAQNKYDYVTGCNKEARENLAKYLDIYMAQIEILAEHCEGRTECGQAGFEFK